VRAVALRVAAARVSAAVRLAPPTIRRGVNPMQRLLVTPVLGGVGPCHECSPPCSSTAMHFLQYPPGVVVGDAAVVEYVVLLKGLDRGRQGVAGPGIAIAIAVPQVV